MLGSPFDGSDSSPIAVKIMESLASIGQGVVRLTTNHGTQKFSVFCHDGETCSLVNLTAPFLSCQSGECQATGLKHKRSAKRLLTEAEATDLCPHLDIMVANKEIWHTEYAAELESECCDQGMDKETHNVEDVDLDIQVSHTL